MLLTFPPEVLLFSRLNKESLFVFLLVMENFKGKNEKKSVLRNGN